MDAERFDTLVRRWASAPRRRLLRLTLGSALASPLALLGAQGVAAGCLQPRRECKRDAQCCSGRCQGPRGRKHCRRAPSQFTCTTRKDACAQGATQSTQCGSNPDNDCFCLVTAKGASLCASFVEDAVTCSDCAAHPGTVCVRGGGSCPLPFYCVRPCPN